MEESTLSEAQKGATYTVKNVNMEIKQQVRLEEMGIGTGEEIKCLCIAPRGSPLLFWVKGTMIALRKNDCAKIMVTKHGLQK